MTDGQSPYDAAFWDGVKEKAELLKASHEDRALILAALYDLPIEVAHVMDRALCDVSARGYWLEIGDARDSGFVTHHIDKEPNHKPIGMAGWPTPREPNV